MPAWDFDETSGVGVGVGVLDDPNGKAPTVGRSGTPAPTGTLCIPAKSDGGRLGTSTGDAPLATPPHNNAVTRKTI